MPVQNYEPLNTNTDVTTTRTLLHEAIPITGAIISGTYKEGNTPTNIKDYSHGQFQSVYDYPYLSSSANHIFDITCGYDDSSTLSSSTSVQNAKKINIYNQFAQVLLGYSGSANAVEIFESDLNFGDNNNQMKEVFFINFSRLLTKDQIRKGSFSLTVMTGAWADVVGFYPDSGTGKYFPAGPLLKLTDASASAALNAGTKNTIGGDYGVLYISASALGGSTGGNIGIMPISGAGLAGQGPGKSDAGGVGIVFYQAGIAVITASLFAGTGSYDKSPGTIAEGTPANWGSTTGYPSTGREFQGSASSDIGENRWVDMALTGAAISASCDALRHRIFNLSFNNTTEINSTIYFCRAPHNKYNYSSNPTYTSGSKIRVKNVASDPPVAYITTIGLYNAQNELLAVAKLSEPLRKDPTNEVTIRVRTDH